MKATSIVFSGNPSFRSRNILPGKCFGPHPFGGSGRQDQILFPIERNRAIPWLSKYHVRRELRHQRSASAIFSWESAIFAL
jgi:hypothetical protein